MGTKEESDFIKKVKGRTITSISTSRPIEGKDEGYLAELDFSEDNYYFTLDNGTVMRIWARERGSISLTGQKKERN